jgi:uncharacterized membrane protein (DUF485 family)
MVNLAAAAVYLAIYLAMPYILITFYLVTVYEFEAMNTKNDVHNAAVCDRNDKCDK